MEQSKWICNFFICKKNRCKNIDNIHTGFGAGGSSNHIYNLSSGGNPNFQQTKQEKIKKLFNNYIIEDTNLTGVNRGDAQNIFNQKKKKIGIQEITGKNDVVPDIFNLEGFESNNFYTNNYDQCDHHFNQVFNTDANNNDNDYKEQFKGADINAKFQNYQKKISKKKDI